MQKNLSLETPEGVEEALIISSYRNKKTGARTYYRSYTKVDSEIEAKK